MDLKEYVIEVTRNAAEESFRYANKVPADKWDWMPLDGGRSVMDICRELAVCPTWALDTINNKDLSEWTEEDAAKARAEANQWKTPEDCYEICKQRLEELFTLYRSLSEERLAETKWLPYEGGRDFTMAEMMDYPRWNFNYHTGQIAYIQTLYGDKEMY